MKTILILFLLFINNTFASYNESINKLTPEEKNIINKSNTYFNNLQTLQKKQLFTHFKLLIFIGN